MLGNCLFAHARNFGCLELNVFFCCVCLLLPILNVGTIHLLRVDIDILRYNPVIVQASTYISMEIKTRKTPMKWVANNAAIYLLKVYYYTRFAKAETHSHMNKNKN